MSSYGAAPIIMGKFDLEPSEMMFVQYLPVVIDNRKHLPGNLRWMREIFNACMLDMYHKKTMTKYAYVTAKHLVVTPDNIGNRPGWHSDGFLTDDVNYIWYDKYPTEFCIQDFVISPDHELSMKQMENQVDSRNIVTYSCGSLIKMDQYSIHRPPVITETSLRTFVKISFSNEKYNLKGNAHNYGLGYDWEMFDRNITRNHPSK